MFPACLLRIIIIFLINILKSQQIHILPDGETWSDDYAIDINGVIGWSYPPDVLSPIIIGSNRFYHGYYEEFIIVQYAGYFYRKFQCQYKSNISITYNAYFGCNYDVNTDTSVVYINQHKFESTINANNNKLFNITDSILVNKSYQCTSNKGKLIGVTPDIFSNSPYIQVNAYTTFDIGFTMIGMGLYEFAAISDINITCHKINQSEPLHNVSTTPTPTILSITDPIDHIACSQITDSSQCNLAAGCGWDTSCTCASGDAVDIIFGIYSELGNDQSETGAIQKWFTDDVFSNINVLQSRVGIISFNDIVNTELNIGYYTLAEITTAFDNIVWQSGYLNFETFFDEVISQFDTIQTINTNTQQILVIITDDNPRIAPMYQVPLCPYRTAFASRNIRVIPIVINHPTNQPDIAEYDCIIQNSFDAILVPQDLTYVNMNSVTNILSAALCPDIVTTDSPTLSPLMSPTLRPTLQPTNPGDDEIEVIISITDPTEINIFNLIAIVANTTGLDKTQISITSGDTTLIITIVGTDKELDLAEKEVEENLENDIEQETGGNVEITSIKRKNAQDEELKDTLTYLIVAICILIFVILVISFICCYCLVIKKKTVKLKDGIEFTVDNKLRKRQSVPSTTLDQPPSPLQAIMNGNSQQEPEMLRIFSECDINQTTTGGNTITDMNMSVNEKNSLLDIDDEDEEEVNKMYSMKSEELSARNREQTITKTGENDHTPGYGPQQSVGISGLDKQMSLNTPQMMTQNGHGHMSMTPLNLSPNVSTVSISPQALQDDLLNNLPLPCEDDNDIVKDMKNEMPNTNPDTHNAKNGEIEVSSDDGNDDNDAMYLKNKDKVDTKRK